MTKRYLTSLVGWLVSLLAMAIVQPQEGKYYRIVNQNPDKSVTIGTTKRGFVIQEDYNSNALHCVEPKSDTHYEQIWKYTGGMLQNAYSQRYITSLYRSVLASTGTTGNLVYLTNKNTHFIITCGMQVHADAQNKIVGWNDEANISNHWLFEEVTVDATALKAAQEEYKKLHDKKQALQAIAAQSNTYAAIVAKYFDDAACTQMKGSYSSKTDAQMRTIMTTDGLPEEVQSMVLRIKNKWSDEFNPTLSAKFRIQNFKCYTRANATVKSKLRATQFSDLNNPTGIWTNTLQLVYVFVDGDIPAGTTLRWASTGGSEITFAYQDGGTSLKKGLNIIYCDQDMANNWIMYTAEADYTQRIDRFPEIKIHIEGGEVLGYADIAGMDETTANSSYETVLKNANSLLLKEGKSPRDINFAVKGTYGLMLYPVECYNQIWADKAWNGHTYRYGIYKAMKFYDDVLMWEWSCMGFMDRVVNGEAKDNGENLTGGEAFYPSHVNNLAPTMMLFKGSNPYSSDSYTCMPSIGGIESSYNANRPDFDVWCVGHESGHNNQGTLNLESCTEASNNLFSNIICHLYGYRLSRGNTFTDNMVYYEGQVPFGRRDISITLRMWYNLYLYYHRAQHKTDFLTTLHKMLREDPLILGRQGWASYEGKDTQLGNAAYSWLKFYKICCDAAQEDLTEYFRLWGFFIPCKRVYFGDYTSYLVDLSQEDIDAAIAEVKAKGYPENKQVCFIEDRLEMLPRTDWAAQPGDQKFLNNGQPVIEEILKRKFGDVGNFTQYMKGNITPANYVYSAAGTSITMQGEGGVGFLVYDNEGKVVWLSNTKTFSIPASVAAKGYTVKAIDGAGTEYVVKDAAEFGTDDQKLAALQTAIEATKEFTKLEDKSGKKVGYYSSDVLANLYSKVAEAQTVVDNKNADQYYALNKALNAEMLSLRTNADAIKQVKPTGVYTIKNFEQNRYLTNSTSTSSSTSGNSSRWMFVPAGDGSYYLQNRSTFKLVNDVFSINGESFGTSLKFLVVPAGDGTFYLAKASDPSKALNDTPNGHKVIEWSQNAGSQWYITEYTEIEEVSTEDIKNLISESEALLNAAGTYSETTTALPLQVDDKSAAYYLSTNQPNANYDISVLLDDNRRTDYYTNTDATGIHYLMVDLGLGNELQTIQFTHRTNNAKDGTSPTGMVVMGMRSTAVPNAVKETLTDIPTGEYQQKLYVSPVISSDKPYRYWRFQVTSTSKGTAYFSMADFKLYGIIRKMTPNAGYENVDQTLMLEAYTTTNDTKSKTNQLPTALNNYYNYIPLKDVYDRLKAAIDTATGIEGITNEVHAPNKDGIYDLNGRRLDKVTQHGIYIINGKKVIK